METKVILDTGVIFDFFVDGDYADNIEKLLKEKRAVLSAITLFELFNGVTNNKHIEDRKNFVSLCDVYSLTADIALQASNLYTSLKKSGKTIQNEDILIAATAIYYNLPILTDNQKHFSLVKNIKLISN